MPQLETGRLNLAPQHLARLQILLAQYVPDAEVWAYGSRVNGGAHEGSDLDLVLRNPTHLAHNLEGWLELKEALQNSTLPILVEVHLWAHLPTSFRPNIEAGYVVLQRGDAQGKETGHAE